MPWSLRPFHLLVCAFAAGCVLPERDNPSDSNLRPTARLKVTLGVGGEEVTTGERWQPLTFDVSDSSVASGSITHVEIERRDARSVGTESCPLLEPRVVAVMDEAGRVAWTDHQGICFEPEEDGSDVFSIPLELRVTVRSSRGATDRRSFAFRLVNARPVADPGPTLWVDPTWGTTVVLKNGANVDPDGDYDEKTIVWTQIAGPPVDLGTSTQDETFVVDLAGDDPSPTDRFGVGFRFRVETRDPWQSSEPVILDVVLRPAVWASTGNGLLLLDGTFTSARMFDDDVTATPVELTGSPVPKFATALDGIWMFRPSSNVVRHIRADFTARALPETLPYIFQDVVGRSDWGVAWILVGPGAGPYQILEVGPGDTFSSTFSSVNTLYAQSMLTRTFISQATEDGNLWAAGYQAGHFRITVFPPNQAAIELNIYSGEPLYEDCLGDTEISSIAADPGGGLWVVTDVGLMRLSPTAEVLECSAVEFEDEGSRTNAFAIPLDGGGSRLLYTKPATDLLLGDPELWTVDPDGTERLFADIPAGSSAYDPLQHRIVVLSKDGVTSYDADDDVLNVPIEFVPLSEVFPGHVYDLFATRMELHLDRAGRPWVFRREGTTDAVLARLPESLRLVRAEVDEAGTLDQPGLGGVDPRTGAVWIAEVTTGGHWVAASYDERGPVPGARIPIPSMTTEIPLYDGVRGLRFDPGDASRDPGIWVHYNAPAAGGGTEIRIARVALDGSVVASFGGPGEEPAGGFPDESTAMYFGASLVVDPSDGSLWMSIHDTDLGDARLGEAYRLGADGTIVRLSTISTQRHESYTTIASPGGLMVTGGNTLHLVRVTPTGMTSQAACFGGDQAGSVSYDAGTAEVILFCASDDGDGFVPSYTTRWDVSSGLEITALRSPTTPFPVTPYLLQLDGRQDAVTGTYWAPDDFGIRMYDRFLQDLGYFPVPARIRYMVQ